MKELDINFIMELMEKLMTPKCPKCNTDLPRYAYYDWDGAFRVCPKCNEVVREE